MVAVEYPGYSLYNAEGRIADEQNIISDAVQLMKHLTFEKKIPLKSIVVVGSFR